MAQDLTPLDPGRFGLSSFAEILAPRNPIIGEDPGSFEIIHEGLMRSLGLITPYECVVAESLIAIEWELIQRRRMRDTALRNRARSAIKKAIVIAKLQEHDLAVNEAWQEHIAAGNDEDDWEEPFQFDKDEAKESADDLSNRAMSDDLKTQQDAYEEIRQLLVDPVTAMSEAYVGNHGPSENHDRAVQALEKRRREVKRDYDQLQQSRPIEGRFVEA